MGCEATGRQSGRGRVGPPAGRQSHYRCGTRPDWHCHRPGSHGSCACDCESGHDCSEGTPFPGRPCALSVTMQVQLSVHQLHCHACSPDEALTRYLLPGALLLVPVLSSFVKLWQGAYNDVYALADRRLLRQSENGLYSRASRQPWAY